MMMMMMSEIWLVGLVQRSLANIGKHRLAQSSLARCDPLHQKPVTHFIRLLQVGSVFKRDYSLHHTVAGWVNPDKKWLVSASHMWLDLFWQEMAHFLKLWLVELILTRNDPFIKLWQFWQEVIHFIEMCLVRFVLTRNGPLPQAVTGWINSHKKWPTSSSCDWLN